MCGITAYIGKRQAVPLLVSSLKKLEYRGYDSAGICFNEGHELRIIKKKGKISELEKAIGNQNFSSKIGMGHTRWATHGIPSDKNSHPHIDCSGKIAVAHNGIIENYWGLKSELEREGHVFRTETDTEVLAHLIEKFHSNGTSLEDAVSKALEKVVGTYGITVMAEGEDKIVAARNGSPLSIGIGEGECFAASDSMAFVESTRKVICLEDHELAVLSAGKCLVRDKKGNEILRKTEEIMWNAAEAEKGGFEHFMLKEIFEQPNAVRNSLAGRMGENGRTKISLNVPDEFFRKMERIVIVACGTSWHAGIVGKYIIEKSCGIPVESDYASEFRYREPALNERTLVIAISQSGETADTLSALRLAKQRGCRILGIINVVGSSIAREVEGGIYIHAGPEIGVASTKAFSCQVACLNLLNAHIAEIRGSMDPEKGAAIAREMELLPEKIAEALEENTKIKEIAKFFAKQGNCIFLGRGINFPVALEGALKMKEISYVHAEGYPAAEMKHGPIALIDESMPVVFLVSGNCGTREKIIGNMQEVRARKGKIIAIAGKEDREMWDFADFVIGVPKTEECLSPIVNVIPLQLLAYHAAVLRGCDVDRPRNLAKSVTVE